MFSRRRCAERIRKRARAASDPAFGLSPRRLGSPCSEVSIAARAGTFGFAAEDPPTTTPAQSPCRVSGRGQLQNRTTAEPRKDGSEFQFLLLSLPASCCLSPRREGPSSHPTNSDAATKKKKNEGKGEKRVSYRTPCQLTPSEGERRCPSSSVVVSGFS